MACADRASQTGCYGKVGRCEEQDLPCSAHDMRHLLARRCHRRARAEARTRAGGLTVGRNPQERSYSRSGRAMSQKQVRIITPPIMSTGSETSVLATGPRPGVRDGTPNMK